MVNSRLDLLLGSRNQAGERQAEWCEVLEEGLASGQDGEEGDAVLPSASDRGLNPP